MAPPIKIRVAKPSDVPKIKRVHIASIQKLCGKDYSSLQIRSWSGGKTNTQYARAMENGESFWVAAQGRRIVGFSVNLGHEIRAVYMHPDHVGLGVGKKLLARAERAAKKQGHRKLFLSSSITALDFYRSQEWKIVRWGKFSLKNGVKIKCIHMRKRV